MDEKEIFNKLKYITEIDPESIGKYQFLIQLAIYYVESKLKKGVDKKNPMLTMLCVCLAYFWDSKIKYANATNSSFSGNGYKISKNKTADQCKAAEEFLEGWRAKTANLLVDEGFCFFTAQNVVSKNE